MNTIINEDQKKSIKQNINQAFHLCAHAYSDISIDKDFDCELKIRDAIKFLRRAKKTIERAFLKSQNKNSN